MAIGGASGGTEVLYLGGIVEALKGLALGLECRGHRPLMCRMVMKTRRPAPNFDSIFTASVLAANKVLLQPRYKKNTVNKSM